MEHPKTKGDISTLAIMLALRASGFDVSIPFGENTRYDLIIDDGRRLARVQCKTGRLRNGSVDFNTCSRYAPPEPEGDLPNVCRRDRSSRYCADVATIYLVPIGDTPPGPRGTYGRVSR